MAALEDCKTTSNSNESMIIYEPNVCRTKNRRNSSFSRLNRIGQISIEKDQSNNSKCNNSKCNNSKRNNSVPAFSEFYELTTKKILKYNNNYDKRSISLPLNDNMMILNNDKKPFTKMIELSLNKQSVNLYLKNIKEWRLKHPKYRKIEPEIIENINGDNII